MYHFIFGVKENFGNKPFQYFHYLSVKSCYLTQNKPEIWIHILHEPKDNIWWEAVKEFAKIIKYDTLPKEIEFRLKGNLNVNQVLISDVFRLLILKKYGGVYADIDTLFYKPLFPYFENEKFVMGLEEQFHKKHNRSLKSGLCNALIISKPNAEFIDIWLNSYEEYYINPKDLNNMAIRTPHKLHRLNLKKQLVRIEPVESFLKYMWSKNYYNEEIQDEPWVWDYDSGDKGIFTKHLYEGMNFNILKTITNEHLKASNSLFAKMCRNINGLL